MKKIIAIALLLCCSASYGYESDIDNKYIKDKEKIDNIISMSDDVYESLIKDGVLTKDEYDSFMDGLKTVYEMNKIFRKNYNDCFKDVDKYCDKNEIVIKNHIESAKSKINAAKKRSELNDRIYHLEKEVESLKLELKRKDEIIAGITTDKNIVNESSESLYFIDFDYANKKLVVNDCKYSVDRTAKKLEESATAFKNANRISDYGKLETKQKKELEARMKLHDIVMDKFYNEYIEVCKATNDGFSSSEQNIEMFFLGNKTLFSDGFIQIFCTHRNGSLSHLREKDRDLPVVLSYILMYKYCNEKGIEVLSDVSEKQCFDYIVEKILPKYEEFNEVLKVLK